MKNLTAKCKYMNDGKMVFDENVANAKIAFVKSMSTHNRQ